MTFDRNKIIAEGGTFHGDDNPLIECAPFAVSAVTFESVATTGEAPATIKEDANLPKRMVIEGVFQRADIRNANQRVYPRGLWERILRPDSAVMKRVAEKAMIGHLEHPTEGTTDLNKGAIRIEKVWMENDGTVRGRAIVFNTPEGQRIQEYVVTGTKIGISSRGTGTVDAKGVVCEDFQLETWDMVYNPSTPGAHPGIASESEQAVHPRQVIESQTDRDTINNHPIPGKPMSLSKRISEVRSEIEPLLAVDVKKLTAEAVRSHAGKILDLRVKIAEEFTGEKRVSEVTEILTALDAARTACEDIDNAGAVSAPVGDVVKTGVPGGAFDVLANALNGIAGEAKAKTHESMKSLADLIAANMGKLPHIQTAVESVCKGTAVSAEDVDGLKKLLGEARDEIIKRTKREEAALALVAETSARMKDLHGKMAVAEAEKANATKIIAELTAAGGKKEEKTEEKKTEESKEVKAADDKKVDESKVEAPAKPLHERIADKMKADSGKDTAALPAVGQKVESAKDAATATAKKAMHEEVTKATGKKSGADLLAAPMKKLAEDVGRSRIH